MGSSEGKSYAQVSALECNRLDIRSRFLCMSVRDNDQSSSVTAADPRSDAHILPAGSGLAHIHAPRSLKLSLADVSGELTGLLRNGRDAVAPRLRPPHGQQRGSLSFLTTFALIVAGAHMTSSLKVTFPLLDWSRFLAQKRQVTHISVRSGGFGKCSISSGGCRVAGKKRSGNPW